MGAVANFPPRRPPEKGRDSPPLPYPVTNQDTYLFAILQALEALIAHEQENRAVLIEIRDSLQNKSKARKEG